MIIVEVIAISHTNSVGITLSLAAGVLQRISSTRRENASSDFPTMREKVNKREPVPTWWPGVPERAFLVYGKESRVRGKNTCEAQITITLVTVRIFTNKNLRLRFYFLVSMRWGLGRRECGGASFDLERVKAGQVSRFLEKRDQLSVPWFRSFFSKHACVCWYEVCICAYRWIRRGNTDYIHVKIVR